MSEKPSADERKQERESKLVGRDKASADTVELLNTLRNNVTDDEAAVAIAILHAQINGDCECYQRPPAREPFGHWHRSLVVGELDVVDVADTTVTVSTTLLENEFLDGDATLTLRASNRESIDGERTTATTTSVKGETVELTVEELEPATEYRLSIMAENEPEADHSGGVNITTKGE